MKRALHPPPPAGGVDRTEIKIPAMRRSPEARSGASPAVAVVMGTRPEIVKLAGIVDELGPAAVIVHTGQHYDRELSGVFFEDLGLPAPDHRMDLGGISRAEQIGRGVAELGRLFDRLRPAAVVVQGDTNSALAGGLAANAGALPLVHVEAGLRSHDRAMPEEHNRVLLDHLADLLAAPTPAAVRNLAREGIGGETVLCCGNTVVEAVHRQLPDAAGRANLLRRFDVCEAGYVLATVHRPENTDDPSVLALVLDSLAALPVPVLMPMHPRTLAAAARAGLALDGGMLRVLPPLSGRDFLGLAAQAALLVSDSGGVQEEVTILGRPLLVVRSSTERPESLTDFARLIRPQEIAASTRAVLDDLAQVHARLRELPSPYGDGSASAQIVKEIRRRFLDRATVARKVSGERVGPPTSLAVS